MTQRQLAEPQVSSKEVSKESLEFQDYLEIYQGVEGWFFPASAAIWDSLLHFQERIGTIGHMLEIGVFRGKSASLLARHTRTPDERCVMMDTKIAEQELRALMKRANPLIENSLLFLESDSAQLRVDTLLTSGFQSFRWVHIDGEHSSGAVIGDLKSADTLLGREGIVCVDDFFNWRYPQITEAVLRYVREHPEQYSLFLVGCNKAYLARPHHVHKYLAFCRDELLDEASARGQELALAKTTYVAEMNTFGIGNRSGGTHYFGPDWAPDQIQI